MIGSRKHHLFIIVQGTLFITTFVITAKFMITSICSAQNLADRVFFLWYSHVILHENIRFVYLLESPRRGDSNKYTKRMIHKETVQKYQLFMLKTSPCKVSL